jgi:hypothetical protein
VNGRACVLDTSYLLELYGVPGFCDEAAKIRIRRRFAEANLAGVLFFVPLPCLLELANHIADCQGGPLREKLLFQLARDVRASRAAGRPWTVTPVDVEVLEQLVASLPDELSRTGRKERGFGLTDAYTAHEASRLKQRERDLGTGRLIHIWTRDRALKAREPDPEPEPFL